MSDVPGAAPTPPVKRPSLAPLVVVAVFFAVTITLVLIGAQRSGEPAPSIAIGRAGTPDQPRPVTVIMRDYLFDPTPLVLVAGETIRLTVFSAGMTTHELVLGDRAVQDAWAGADAAATPPAPSPRATRERPSRHRWRAPAAVLRGRAPRSTTPSPDRASCCCSATCRGTSPRA